MSDELNLSSKDIAVSGFKAIKRIEGTLLPPVKSTGKYNEQLTITLTDAVILEMTPGEPAPELKEDKFTYYLKFGKQGAVKPSAGTFLARAWIPDGEILDAKRRGVPKSEGIVANLFNTRVQLVYKELTSKIKKEGEEEAEEISFGGLTFSTDAMSPKDIQESIKKLVLGFNKTAVSRNLNMDALAKTYPEYKSALNDGTLAAKLGVKFDEVNKIFVEAG